MDLDLTLRVDSPPSFSDESTSDVKKDLEGWEKSNQMCILIMKKAIPEAFSSSIYENITTIKECLVDMETKFIKKYKG